MTSRSNKFRAVLMGLTLAVVVMSCQTKSSKILVFSKTEGYRHQSIEAGVAAVTTLGKENGFMVDATEDASWFTEDNLAGYSAVVFLNTTQDILDSYQQADFERYIQAGGGFVGIHSAADTEYHWPWYGKLVGGYFMSHPATQEAKIDIVDSNHSSTSHLPAEWVKVDEWYDYKNFNQDVNVLMTVDESSYEGAKMGDPHPIAWYHEFDGGRAFYTGLGHTEETFSNELFLKHLLAGIQFAIGDNAKLNYQTVSTTRLPEQNRFTKVVLDQNLYEPTEMAVFDDERVLFVERHGDIKLWKPDTEETEIIAHLDVYDQQEDGLMGLALDPNFSTNNWIYLYYSPAGDQPKQHLSRFTMNGDNLDLSTEVVMLEVPTQRDECCHTGGSIAFGPDRNLFLSTGDDTNPFASGGYDPIDERPGRSPWDAQGSSGNTNDLRGKVLRIKPEADGSYSIPEGNLFASDGSQGKPEIYVMGCRNPYRVSVDQKTGFLYWGDVGPDAGEDSVGRGPRGHDEINQARKAGNFGWPHFVGDNKAYNDYNFETAESGNPFDPQKPNNDSPNNTGMETLPPAQSAFIWYPYAASPEFPILGTGGRTAMAGPVFYADAYTKSDTSFPDYYNGKLFIYEWMRGWIMAVTMDERGDLIAIEPFMPSTEFNNPCDMYFAKDGSLYVLEYGTTWNQRNQDARLVRIEYTAGNRSPRPRLALDKTQGAAPTTVSFSSLESMDFDGDDISFEWSFGVGDAKSSEANPSFTYENPGIYTATLVVTDSEGNTAEESVELRVGNDPPQIDYDIPGNSTFFRLGQDISYSVAVNDLEDGTTGEGINPDNVLLTYAYNPQGKMKGVNQLGHQTGGGGSSGLALIQGSDCMACHDEVKKSIGPAYNDVALKYKGQAGSREYLAKKIIAGGGGVWGDQAMAAHPQLSQEDVNSMVKYILSLADKNLIPLSGTIEAQGESGFYLFSTEYTDRGGDEVGPTTSKEQKYLRSPVVPAVDVDRYEKTRDQKYGDTDVPFIRNRTLMVLEDIDLSGIGSISFAGGINPELEGEIEVHADSPGGEILGTAPLISKGGKTHYNDDEAFEATASLPSLDGRHDLYLVVTSKVQNDFGSLHQIIFKFAEDSL